MNRSKVVCSEGASGSFDFLAGVGVGGGAVLLKSADPITDMAQTVTAGQARHCAPPIGK